MGLASGEPSRLRRVYGVLTASNQLNLNRNTHRSEKRYSMNIAEIKANQAKISTQLHEAKALLIEFVDVFMVG